MWASGTGSKVSSTAPNTSSVVPLQLLFRAPEHSARFPQLFIFFLFGALSCQSIKRTEKTKLARWGGGKELSRVCYRKRASSGSVFCWFLFSIFWHACVQPGGSATVQVGPASEFLVQGRGKKMWSYGYEDLPKMHGPCPI